MKFVSSISLVCGEAAGLSVSLIHPESESETPRQNRFIIRLMPIGYLAPLPKESEIISVRADS